MVRNLNEEIKTLTIKDKNYPELLKEIADPPAVLYYRGKVVGKENCLAVVGTRLCSAYGKQIALEIAADLSEAGLTIVSGLAPGIDTYTHRAVVERTRQNFSSKNLGGRAIAVLGTGLDEKSIYPQTNLKLAREILETGGCLISEYPPGTAGSRFTFPRRNRIISGLCPGVLVVEAKQKSGALNTAAWARKQKRKVFAVPGSIYSSNSKGPHFLIKQGAKLIENANDILKEIAPFKELKLPFSSGERETAEGNWEESQIIKALEKGALDIDKIIEKTKLPASKAAGTLAVLEIKGKVRNLGRNIYALSR